MKTQTNKIFSKISKHIERVFYSLLPTALLNVVSLNRVSQIMIGILELSKVSPKSDSRFKNFKRSQVYREVLEHVTRDQAEDYLRQIQENNPKFLRQSTLEKVSANDLVGNPPTFDFDCYGRFSGPTIRYLKVCADLDQFFDLEKVEKIAEIGGGYGGQALVYDRIFDYSQYSIFDLALVCDLINKYLDNYFLHGGIDAYEINKCPREGPNFDLVISNYAFSELPKNCNIYIWKKSSSDPDEGT